MATKKTIAQFPDAETISGSDFVPISQGPLTRKTTISDILSLFGAGVTSVGLSAPSIFTVFGSPIVSSGTLSFDFISQGNNRVLASPDGVSGTPSFRPLAPNDYPTMVGDSGVGGVKGAVPAPNAGDTLLGKFLKADGTWEVPGSSTINTTGSMLISGGGVVWTSGLNFTVSAAEYQIQGTNYTSAQTNITLGAADPTNARFDIIAVNTSGAVVVIPGTPSAAPALPDIDLASQLMLTFVQVPASASAPVVTDTPMYLDNAEWTTSVSGASINPASPNNPFQGTLDIEGTAVIAADWVMLQKPSGTTTLGPNDNLVFYIRSKATWPSAKLFSLQWRNNGANIGTPVSFKSGTYGFNSSLTSNYQAVIIPASAFGTASLPINQLRITVTGGGSSIGFYLDSILIQAGISAPSQQGTVTLLGDVTGSGTDQIQATIAAQAVTYTKIQNVSATDRLLGRSTAGAGTIEEVVCTAAGRALLDDANASAQRTTLGLVINTDVQAYDADLATIAGLTATTDNFIQAKSSAWASRTPTQVTADLIPMVGDSGSGGTKGLVPAPAAGDAAALKFLKADGTWAIPAGGGGSSPTTTKGDMIVRSASADSRLPVGTDGQIIVADSAQTLGVKWDTREVPNFLLNTSLRWWQDGTSFVGLTNTSTPKWTADQWFSWSPGFGAAPNYTVSRIAATLPKASYGMKVQRNSGNTSTNHIHTAQILESFVARGLAGKTVTFAVNLLAGANFSGASSQVTLQVISGTVADQGAASYIADSWTGRTILASILETISPTTSQVFVTVTVPSNAQEIAFEWSWAPVGTAGADDSVSMEIPYVVLGTIPVDFIATPDIVSLLQCQRFYRKTYNPDIAPGTVTNNGALTWASAISGTGTCYGFVGNLGPYMRVSPTRTAYSPVTGTSGNAYQYDASADVAVTMSSSFNNQQSWAPTKSTGDWTAGNRIGIHCVEDARLN